MNDMAPSVDIPLHTFVVTVSTTITPPHVAWNRLTGGVPSDVQTAPQQIHGRLKSLDVQCRVEC